MTLKMNHKAQIFSMLVLLLIGLMFISVELFSFLHERGVIRTRVSTMDTFLKSIEDNLDKQVYISGYRIMFLAGNYIVDTGVYLGDDIYYTSADPVFQFFNESFLNGSVAGVEQPLLFTYSQLADSIVEKGEKMNLDIIFQDPPELISITQNNPWFVNFSVAFNLTMEDRENLASWNRFQVVSAYVPVTGFRDPIYNVETYNKVERLIQKTPYTVWNVGNLNAHVTNGYYSNNTDAPSFLKRLVGNLSSDPNGIESFVIRPDLSTQGIPTQDKSCVDYTYFGVQENGNAVSGMPGWFLIDDAHRSIYCLGCP
ncbi:MAG: hypothetical protein ABIB79_05050 [archaeon]